MILKDETSTIYVANGNILRVSAKLDGRVYFKMHDGSSFEARYAPEDTEYNMAKLEKLFIIALYSLDSIDLSTWITQFLKHLAKQEGNFVFYGDTDITIDADGDIKGEFFGVEVNCNTSELVKVFDAILKD